MEGTFPVFPWVDSTVLLENTLALIDSVPEELPEPLFKPLIGNVNFSSDP